MAGGLNLYGFANGDPVNYADPFGLYAERQNEAGSIHDRLANAVRQDAARATNSDFIGTQAGGGNGHSQASTTQQPTAPGGFGTPKLGPYRKNRQLHLGGMVVGIGVTPSESYSMSVALEGRPGVTGILTVRRRNSRDANFGTEHVYSGTLRLGDEIYSAQLNLKNFSGVTWGFIDVDYYPYRK